MGLVNLTSCLAHGFAALTTVSPLVSAGRRAESVWLCPVVVARKCSRLLGGRGHQQFSRSFRLLRDEYRR